MAENRKKLTNFDIYEDELCALFLNSSRLTTWLIGNTKFNARYGSANYEAEKSIKGDIGVSKLNIRDEDGRTFLHHLILQDCYKTTLLWMTFPSGEFYQQLYTLSREYDINIYARDKFDNFPFDYIDSRYYSYSLSYSYARGKMFISDLFIRRYSEDSTNKKMLEIAKDNIPHPYSGSNLLHKLANIDQDFADENSSLLYPLLYFFSGINSSQFIRQYYEMLEGAYDFSEEKLTKLILTTHDIDIYLENYQQKQPIEIATNHKIAKLLYVRFINDLSSGKYIEKIYPWLQYGFNYYNCKNYQSCSDWFNYDLINTLQKQNFSFCDQQHGFDGNSILQLFLSSKHAQILYNIHNQFFSGYNDRENFNKKLSIIIKIFESCLDQLDLPNYNGLTLRTQLIELVDKIDASQYLPAEASKFCPLCPVISFPWINKIDIKTYYPYTVFYSVIGYKNPFVKLDVSNIKATYAKLTEELQLSGQKIKSSIELLQADVTKELELSKQSDIKRDNKLSSIRNILNPKKWFEAFKLFITEQGYPEKLVLKAAETKIINEVKTYLVKTELAQDNNEQNTIYSYRSTIKSLEKRLTNLNQLIQNATEILKRKPVENMEMDKQLDGFIKLLNIVPKEEIVYTKLRSMIEEAHNFYYPSLEGIMKNELIARSEPEIEVN